MQVQPQWPDVEDVVIAMLTAVAPTVTATPADLSTPVIQVVRVGGPADIITDTPNVVIDCFAPDRPTAWANARQCQQIILASRRQSFSGGLVDAITVVSGLQQVPYDDPNVRRVTGTYRLAFRRPFTP